MINPAEKPLGEWNLNELSIAILQVLLAARKRKPASGGASGKMLMDCLQLEDLPKLESALSYLRERDYIETFERIFMITGKGLVYLHKILKIDIPESSIAILQLLFAARKENPSNGGVGGKMLMDRLRLNSIVEIEFDLWCLRSMQYMETGDRVFLITVKGLEYLNNRASKNEDGLGDSSKDDDSSSNTLDFNPD